MNYNNLIDHVGFSLVEALNDPTFREKLVPALREATRYVNEGHSGNDVAAEAVLIVGRTIRNAPPDANTALVALAGLACHVAVSLAAEMVKHEAVH